MAEHDEEEMSTQHHGEEGLRKELDILKDLPSFNKDNFSRFTPGGGSLNKVSFKLILGYTRIISILLIFRVNGQVMFG